MKRVRWILLLSCLFLSGCWDQRELNELAIMVGLGIDKSEEGYLVSAQIIVPSEVSPRTSGGRSPATLFQSEGKTVYEAIRKMTKESPRKIYPGHLQIFVFGDDIAREGIRDTLDLLIRDWEVRSDFYMVVARDQSASDILKVKTPISGISSINLYQTLKASEKNAAVTRTMTVQDVFSDVASEGKDPVLTGIQRFGGSEIGKGIENVQQILPEEILLYDHLAIFKDDRLINWLDDEETEAFNYMTRTIPSSVKAISCPDGGDLTIEVNHSKSDIKAVMKNGSPAIDVRIKATGSIGSVECVVDLNDEPTIHELEQTFEKILKSSSENTVRTLQQRDAADIFGFGESIRKAYPKEWEKLKKDWPDAGFPELPVEIKVSLKIKDTGTIKNSLLQ